MTILLYHWGKENAVFARQRAAAEAVVQREARCSMKLKRLRGLTQRYSFFFFIFLSYLSVLLFSVLFSAYNYGAYLGDLREQKAMYDEVMLQQLDEMIGAELDKANAQLVNVLMDTDIMKAVAAEDLVSGSRLSQTLRAANQMRSYSKAVSGMYIYFENGDAIIMDGAYYRPEDFYARFIDGEAIGFEAWYAQQTAQHDRACRQAFTSTPNELVLYHTVMSAGAGRRALVAIRIDLENILRIFKDSFFSGQMAFQITDGSGAVLADYGWQALPDGESERTAPFVSRRTGWTYASAIPSAVYNRAANELLLRSAAVLLVELAAGVLLSFFFARTNIAPIRRIYKRLSGGGTRPGAVKNEYELVDSCMKTLLEEKEQLLRQHDRAVKNNLLLELLNGGAGRAGASADYAEVLGADPEAARFRVASIAFSHGDAARAGSLESRSLMKYCLTELLGKAFQTYRLHIADVNWNQTAVILHGGLEDGAELICRRMEQVRQAAEAEFHVSLSIGVGGVHRAAAGAGLSYRESLMAQEYRLLEDLGAVCLYRDIPDGAFPKSFYPALDRAKIKARIRAGDGPGTAELLDKVFAGIAANRQHMPLGAAKCLFFEIMGVGLEVLAEIRFEHETAPGEYMRQLFDCQTIGQLQCALNRILLEICGAIKKGQSSRNQQILDRIHAYIGRNCYDNSFSLVGLADYMGLTPTYLSSFFKEKTGVNLVDRITELRMARAKAMLLETNRNVAEIAVQVGYGSSGTFIRKFKQLEGITPVQYRQEHAGEPGSAGLLEGRNA